MGCYIGEVGDGLFGGYSNPWKRVLEADNKAALGQKRRLCRHIGTAFTRCRDDWT
ncbi:MAG TPA: hypothetical protein H9863_09700 [Candidatus Odoribacter faecigallinarum]|uniref:Uncharacterized protein n=1 Tax=Candidatus Odoribacter faecigallinarum TaxID=2838706 RepID=A0A9D1V1S1_9BACT|nr:hypothetical protein [Candidatus Odoribacter faecigallinarum]